MRVIFATVLLMLVAPSAWSAETTRSWSQFYDTEYGQLGVIRNVEVEQEPSITLLNPGQPATIPHRGQTHLVFNHFNRRSDADLQSARYVAVMVFVAYSNHQGDDAAALTTYRNAGWWRPTCPSGRRVCFNLARDMHEISRGDIENELMADRGQGDLDRLDRDLGHKFDGYPVPNTSLNSWNERDFWQKPAKDVAICHPQGTRCVLNYYLLKFIPTTSGSSRSPLDFYVTTWNATAMSIYARSPQQDEFRRNYTIQFSY